MRKTMHGQVGSLEAIFEDHLHVQNNQHTHNAHKVDSDADAASN
jgi:hypothetical protein